MTKIHHHHEHNSEFVRSRAGTHENPSLSRRDFLKTGTVIISGALLPRFLADLDQEGLAQQLKGKRIYIAPDDHTDLFWTADLNTYERAFVEMLDYYLDLADKTQNEPLEFQSRWNCDGSFWAWVYEQKKSQADFERLIERIRDGHISLPLNALCVCLGGAPAEAVLRGMYYPGKLERRYNLRFNLAYSIENQTLPFGLGALWAGSGATFSWKGICGCATKVPDAGDREHDIYWWVGADGSKLLMKWNSMLNGNQSMGGYAEAKNPEAVVSHVAGNQAFIDRYPYQVIGAFGYGWDDLQSQSDVFVETAKNLSNQNFKVIVSNEIDFAQDFEETYGDDIPSLSTSFGNEWDLDCATMAEVSARVKRAVEKLRTAESLATLVSLKKADFMQGREEARDRAWMNLGLFWEHDWQGAPWEGLTEKRIQWTRKITAEIESYVNTLFDDALRSLGGLIRASGSEESFFVFNPLNWMRTDYVDFEYQGTELVHVIDKESAQETPSQFVMKAGKRWLRILAVDVPPVGYKVFEIRQGAGGSFSNAADVSDGQLENEYLKVTVDGCGAINRLEDKKHARQLAAEINGRFLNDLGAGAGNLEIENEGPVSVTLLATADTPLAHTTRISLFRNSDRLEIQNDITQNFNDTHTWAFGFAIKNPAIYHEEVGAILNARLTEDGGHYSPRNARYDWLTLNHFVDLNQNDGFGVTISNTDCYFMKLGNSTAGELDTNTPQISIMVGGRDMNDTGALGDQGGDDHFMQRFALRAHEKFDQISAMKFALEHQNPLVAGRVAGGESYPEASFSFLSIDNPDVILWALKPADDGVEAGLVARVWNLSNEHGNFSLNLNEIGIDKALTLTHIETPTGDAVVQSGKLVESINQQQIKTYALFPAQTPAITDTPAAPTATATPEVQATDTKPVEASLTPTSELTRTPAPTQSPTPTPAPQGEGCLLGLLKALLSQVR
jgi:alpha-mannosidase